MKKLRRHFTDIIPEGRRPNLSGNAASPDIVSPLGPAASDENRVSESIEARSSPCDRATTRCRAQTIRAPPSALSLRLPARSSRRDSGPIILAASSKRSRLARRENQQRARESRLYRRMPAIHGFLRWPFTLPSTNTGLSMIPDEFALTTPDTCSPPVAEIVFQIGPDNDSFRFSSKSSSRNASLLTLHEGKSPRPFQDRSKSLPRARTHKKQLRAKPRNISPMSLPFTKLPELQRAGIHAKIRPNFGFTMMTRGRAHHLDGPTSRPCQSNGNKQDRIGKLHSFAGQVSARRRRRGNNHASIPRSSPLVLFREWIVSQPLRRQKPRGSRSFTSFPSLPTAIATPAETHPMRSRTCPSICRRSSLGPESRAKAGACPRPSANCRALHSQRVLGKRILSRTNGKSPSNRHGY